MIEFLRQQGIPISEELAFDLKEHFKLKKIQKNEYLHQEGKTCKFVAFLLSGKIIYYHNIEGKMRTRWVGLPNTFVTSLASFISEMPSKENLWCITNCELLICDKSRFLELKNNYEVIEKLWTSALETEIVGYEYRVFQLITTDAEQRYLNFMDTYPEFITEVPQKYIASMLGIEPRHLTRIRKKLANK